VSAWYEDAFRRDYLKIYSHRDDAEAGRDVADILRLIDPPRNAPLLDLCCGPGRHLVAFRQAGFAQLTGLDLSEDLLCEARARLAAAGIEDVQLIRADMRSISTSGRYRTVVSLFTSFGYFETDEQDEQVLAAAYDALAAGGTLLLDTLNRGYVLTHLVPDETRHIAAKNIDIRRSITDDGKRIEKETQVSQPGFPATITRESVRMYQQSEIETMLRRIGYVRTRFHGALDGRPFAEDSPRMVFVASKRGI
jgi:ubiquinone/menaquinone biosynthesis C-methylase UbiE